MLGIILEVVMLTLALIVILHRDFMTSLIVYSLTSLVFILLVLLSYAPDVAAFWYSSWRDSYRALRIWL